MEKMTKLEKFNLSATLVTEFTSQFERIIGDDAFEQHIKSVKDLDEELFDRFRHVVSVLQTAVQNADSTATPVLELKQDIVPVLEELRAEVPVIQVEETAADVEMETHTTDETVIEQKEEPVDDNIRSWKWSKSSEASGNVFEDVTYYEDGRFYGEVSGWVKPIIYKDGSIKLPIVKKVNICGRPTKLYRVGDILSECGALPVPKALTKQKHILAFINGNRTDYRLSNMHWIGGYGRTKECRDTIYLKRIIRDALNKLGYQATESDITEHLNQEKENISQHMVVKLLPIVKKELEDETKRNSPKEEIKFIEEWKNSLKCKFHPDREEIRELKSFLMEKGYIKEDFSFMAVKNIIAIMTGYFLDAKDVKDAM